MSWYYNQNNERIEVSSISQLISLVEDGEIMPDTRIEISEGNIIPARRVRITDKEGNRTKLPFRETPSPQLGQDSSIVVVSPTPVPLPTPPTPTPVPPVTLSPKHVFCTNCGNSVSEQAVACMSCGLRPTGHKKFCRQCGARRNPAHIVCIQCGVKFPSPLDSLWDSIVTLMPTFQTTGTPQAPQKQRINFWTICCIVLLVLYAAMSYKYVRVSATASDTMSTIVRSMNEQVSDDETLQQMMAFGDEAVKVFGLQFLIWILWIAYLCCFYFYLQRLWEEVPGQFARTTPKRAARLSFIPLFQLYWWFVVFKGLYHDMNEAIESYGHDTRLNVTPINLVCVGWVILAVLYGALSILSLVAYVGLVGIALQGTLEEMKLEPFVPLLMGRIQQLLTLLLCLNTMLTVPMYWIIRTNVHEFIDIKSNSHNVPKKTKKVPTPIVVTGIVILCLLLFSFASGASSTSGSPSTGGSLVGRWKIEQGTSSRVVGEDLELLKDGTGVIDSIVGVTWKTESGRLHFTAPFGMVAYRYKVSGSTLTLTDDTGFIRYKRR